MKIKCDSRTCKYYESGFCQAEEIEIKNFTWYSEEEKEELDKPACSTYEYDKDWVYKNL